MGIFSDQKALIVSLGEYLKTITALTDLNFYVNQIVFLQDYELPAVLIYSFRNEPVEPKSRDTLGQHDRNLDIRFELRFSPESIITYEEVADTIYKAVLEYRRLNKLVDLIGNPTFQIGLDEKKPDEMVATLDITIYYKGKPNAN